MGKYTKISNDAFDTLQLDAGVLLFTFDPSNLVEPESENIIATTTGGISITCAAEFSDFGEDVDNVPNNMMEFKVQTGWECSISFSTIKFNADNTAFSLGAADTTVGANYTKIVPRRDLKLTDFKDIWWVGDKVNGGAFAVRLMNALSTAGLSIQTTKNGKGTNQITLTGHVSIDAQDTMPMEFYDIQPEETAKIVLDKKIATVATGATTTLTATTTPTGQTVTWTSSNTSKATVNNGVVTGVAAGSTTITAKITVDGVDYTDTCTVTVTE